MVPSRLRLSHGLGRAQLDVIGGVHKAIADGIAMRPAAEVLVLIAIGKRANLGVVRVLPRKLRASVTTILNRRHDRDLPFNTERNRLDLIS
jgi:hypothetical protein